METIQAASESKPDETALAFYANSSADPVTITWRRLWDETVSLGSALTQRFAPGDPLLLVFGPGLDFYLTQLACHHAGCVPIPVPMPGERGERERLESVIAQSGCIGVITEGDAAQTLTDLTSNLDRSVPIVSFKDLSAQSVEAAVPAHPSTADDLAFIQYTSGSVGEPKGVAVTHGNLIANVKMMTEGHQMGGEIIVSWVPHFHDMGLVGNFYAGMHTQSPLHVLSPEAFVRRPLSWLRLISQTRATNTTVPHFALGLCCRLAHTLKPGDIDLSSLRLIVNSSEPVAWDGLAEFERIFAAFGLPDGCVVPHYGLAECTVMVSHAKRDRPRFLDVNREELTKGHVVLAKGVDAKRTVSCGSGHLDCEVAIVDPQTGRPCGEDRVGEIWITGSHVARGYWRQPQETAATFGQTLPNDNSGKSYVRSGDLGFVHGGDLFVTGRMKDVIIVRGRNHFAQDIEDVAEDSSPLIRKGRVAAIASEYRGEEAVGLIAEVAPRFDPERDASGFITAFSRRLHDKLGLTARRITLVRRNSLPRTTSGKIRRGDAGALYRDGQLPITFEYEMSSLAASRSAQASFPGIQDRAALHGWLAERFAQEAGVSEIADADDLFALGIDSLSATHLLMEIEELSGVSLLDERFYAQPTLATLLDILAQGGAKNAEQQPEPIPPPEPAPSARSFRKRVAHRLRVTGPIIGAAVLPYKAGSRVLDRILNTHSGLERLSRPYAADLESLVAQLRPSDEDAFRREFARCASWIVWRERALANPETFARFVTVSGLERVAQARTDGRGVILGLVHSHLNGLLKFVPELTERPFNTVANLPEDRAEFYGMGGLARASGSAQSQTIPAARVAQIHKAHDVLRQAGTVAVFMDAFEGFGGIRTQVATRLRPIRPGIAQLALDTGSTVIPTTFQLHEGGRITLEFHQPFHAAGVTHNERLMDLMFQQARTLDTLWRDRPGSMNYEALRAQLKLPPHQR
ncbi:MAG: AMP-binding protein [Pseudomonadota bacterium]